MSLLMLKIKGNEYFHELHIETLVDGILHFLYLPASLCHRTDQFIDFHEVGKVSYQ